MQSLQRAGESRPYLAFLLPAEETQRGRIMAAVNELCNKIPELPVVVLDPHNEEADLRAMGELPFLIPLKTSD